MKMIVYRITNSCSRSLRHDVATREDQLELYRACEWALSSALSITLVHLMFLVNCYKLLDLFYVQLWPLFTLSDEYELYYIYITYNTYICDAEHNVMCGGSVFSQNDLRCISSINPFNSQSNNNMVSLEPMDRCGQKLYNLATAN